MADAGSKPPQSLMELELELFRRNMTWRLELEFRDRRWRVRAAGRAEYEGGSLEEAIRRALAGEIDHG